MWLPPIACTVIGASHQRKGKPCQDASLSRSFISKGGEELHLMVVSDGHGGERYWLSDVGSRLACQEAANAVEAAAKKYCLDDQGHWQNLLAEELPRAIHSQWLDAIDQDWQNQPNPVQQNFSPQLYGCTLGLVLMAPRWWGHTGLGDWDLVICSETEALLLSEEGRNLSQGEATASLCLVNMHSEFKSRAKLYPRKIKKEEIITISTDGIRKSCAADKDFIELIKHLSTIIKTEELKSCLIEITQKGSGDDLSLAMCSSSSTKAKGKSRQGTNSRRNQKERGKWFYGRKKIITAIYTALAITISLAMLGHGQGKKKPTTGIKTETSKGKEVLKANYLSSESGKAAHNSQAR